MWSSSNYLLPNCILTCFNIINDPTLRCSSKFSSLHADKHAYCASLPYILPGLRLHILVAYNKYKDFKQSNNNGNFMTHLGKRCPLGLWHRDPTGCLRFKSMINLRLRVEHNIGWLGQRQVCQCFYFWHIVTYLNHPIPITSSTLTTSQRLAKQTLSLLWLCSLVLFYKFDQANAECAFTHTGTVHIYRFFCPYSALYLWFVVQRSLQFGENCSSDLTSMYQSVVSRTEKYLKEQSMGVNATFSHFFGSLHCRERRRPGWGQARERMKPHSQQGWMLTIPASFHAWASEWLIQPRLSAYMCVSVHVAMVTWV